MVYQIKIKGHLHDQWTDWFAGLAITLEESGDTLLTGPVVDQAALKVHRPRAPLHHRGQWKLADLRYKAHAAAHLPIFPKHSQH